MRFRLLLPAVLLGLATPVQARLWFIEADGSGDASTIQSAIDQAAAGDQILVEPGTYYESLELKGRDIVLQSTLGPNVTILDGSLRDSAVVTIHRGETHATRVEGFTIQGGSGNDRGGGLRHGGGMFVLDASPVIVGNVFLRNATNGWGGGLAVDTSTDLAPQIEVLVQGNRFEDNTAGRNGGGMVCWGAKAEVYDNVFVGNEAAFDGGGIYLAQDGAGSFRLRGNQFWENVAQDHGGALECAQQGQAYDLTVDYNLFVRNEAHGNDGASDNGTGGAISLRGWSGTVRFNTFAGNVGTGGDGCTGGAILVAEVDRPIWIVHNIFYGSEGCAVTCRAGGGNQTTVQHNLFWQNDADIGSSLDCEFGAIQDNLYEDPLFCGPEMDNYTVRVDSPALKTFPLIGVWRSPGCGPGTPIESSTWGRLKLRFRD